MTELDLIRNHFLGFHNDFFDNLEESQLIHPTT